MKLYVGNLPYTFSNKELAELFAPFGEVAEATVIMDKFSGRSKGFGFVTMNDDEAAKKAMSELNSKDIGGRQIKVNEAQPLDPNSPRPPRRSFGGPRRSFGGHRDRY